MAEMVEMAEPAALRILRHPLVVLAALAGGVAIGVLAPGVGLALKPIGQIYLFMLEMTVLPILILAIAAGVTALVQKPGVPGLLLRAFLVMLLFFIVAGFLGLAAALVVRPGAGMSREDMAVLSGLIRLSPQGADTAISLSDAAAPAARASVLDQLTGIVPRNPFASLTAGTVLPCVLLSLLIGMAIGLMRDKQKDYLLGIAQNALAAFRKVNLWLLFFLPFGAVCLVSSQVATTGLSLLPVLAEFLLALFAAMAAAAVLLLLVLWLRSGKGLRRTVSALVEPLTYALITGSGLFAVPYSLRALEDKLGFDAERVDATLPIATVLGRCGTLLTFVVAAFFVGNFYGVGWSITDYATLFAAAAGGAIASAGAGGTAALGAVTLVFAPLGLPTEPVVVVFSAASLVIQPVLAALETQAAITAVSLFIKVRETVRVRVARRRMLSIRATILVLLATLITLTGSVTIGLMYSGQRRNISYLADELIADVSARSVQRTLNYLSPAERAAEGIRYLLAQGLVDTGKPEALLAALRNFVVSNPEFASAYFGDASGRFTMVKRMPDGSLSQRIITRTADAVKVVWKHENPAYRATFPDSLDSLAQGYDPRTRGWYRGAVAAKGRIWTDVYLFASDNMLGISNAVPIYGPAGTVEGVAAVDIGLAELSYFLGSLDISSKGKAFLLNEKDQLVALSVPRGSDLSALFSGSPTGSAASTANLVPAEEASDELVRQAHLAYLRQGGKSTSFSFAAGGKRYVSAFTAFPETAAFRWRIAVVLPEAQIYGTVNTTSQIVLAAALLIIIASIGIGVNFSRAITVPLHRLSLEMERIRNFDLSSREKIESGISEIHNMTESFSNMKHGLSAFNKYVPSKLVAELIRLGEEPKIGGQRRNLTILFSDIADFTTVSERLEPEKLVDEMSVYLGALSNAIMRNRGTVDKYIGDAIMAFWNAPGEVADHQIQACLSALECQEILAKLRAAGPKDAGAMSVFTNRTRMGIHSGEVVVGNMGSDERLSYTAVGDSVNLASRLEGLNKYYGTTVIVSGITYAAAKGVVAARLVDRVAVKGRQGGIEIYELMGRREGMSPADLHFIEVATGGVRRYLDGDFSGAAELSREALGIREDDAPSRIILQRCEEYLRVPPPKEWDGVYVHHAK